MIERYSAPLRWEWWTKNCHSTGIWWPNDDETEEAK